MSIISTQPEHKIYFFMTAVYPSSDVRKVFDTIVLIWTKKISSSVQHVAEYRTQSIKARGSMLKLISL